MCNHGEPHASLLEQRRENYFIEGKRKLGGCYKQRVLLVGPRDWCRAWELLLQAFPILILVTVFIHVFTNIIIILSLKDGNNLIIRVIILVKLYYILWILKIQPVCSRYIAVDHREMPVLTELKYFVYRPSKHMLLTHISDWLLMYNGVF